MPLIPRYSNLVSSISWLTVSNAFEKSRKSPRTHSPLSWKFHDDAMMGTWWTRGSENDNTPQPLVQWTNSPFTGQQVGNCKSFTLTHYLADLYVMLRGPRSIPLCIQHHIQLTSLSFQVSETSHCWVTAISIFNLENLRSRSWMRSKFEATMWV